MPSIEVSQFFQALTADGDATGYATVTSTAGFYAGCIAFIMDDDALSQKRCVITEIKDATHVGLRFIANDNEQQGAVQLYGGRSNLTGYTVAKHSKVFMERQLARVENAYSARSTPNV